MKVVFESKQNRSSSRFRSVKLKEILTEDDIALLTTYISLEKILEVHKTTKPKSTPKPVPTPIKKTPSSSGQGFTNMVFNGLIWMMVIALLEIGGGYYFDIPITDNILFPISLELTLILIAWYHIRSHQQSALTRKTLAYVLSGTWLVVGSVGIFAVYSWDDLKPHIEREVTASLSQKAHVFLQFGWQCYRNQ